MNWDAIGAMGTLVGGVAVLLTLVYLSIQVQAFFDVSESYLRLIHEIDLGGQEEVLASIVRARIGIPGMAEWWRRNVGDYDPRFVDWVEGIRESA